MPKRPKKTVIQFVVAALIACVVGGVGVLVTFLLINNLSSQNQQLASQYKQDKEALESKIAKLNASLVQSTETIPQEVRAVVKIPSGQIIEATMVEEVRLNTDEKPSLNHFSHLSEVVGQAAGADILPGEMLTKDKVVITEGMLPLRKGKRAISIMVNRVGMVSGAVQPGSRVDILATFNQEAVTRTLLQNVRVIQTGLITQSAPAPADAKGAPANNGANNNNANTNVGSFIPITVEVSPREAEILALANKEAVFHLSLRPFGDQGINAVGGTNIGQVISGVSSQPMPKTFMLPGMMPGGFSSPFSPQSVNVDMLHNPAGLPTPAVPEPQAKRFKMEILRGTSSESQDFDWED